MLGFRYAKAPPTTHVLVQRGGKIVHQGRGITCIYFALRTTVSWVPVASQDLPLAFELTTADYQQVTVQGQLTWRIANPVRVAELLDFSIRANGSHASQDPERLSERIVQAVRARSTGHVQQLTLREALRSLEPMAAEVLRLLRTGEELALLGAEALSLTITSIQPAPEMARALEAEAREALQRESDAAIAARRQAAVEHERKIREREMETEIRVAELTRQKQETEMAGQIAVEAQRRELIATQVENDRKAAEARAYALSQLIEAAQKTDWRLLLALQGGGMDPRANVALAFRELASTSHVGTLNITPDLLTELVRAEPATPRPPPTTAPAPSRK
jgi:regulator of protease activity HflC (stomatin/prohibitin superfamily)